MTYLSLDAPNATAGELDNQAVTREGCGVDVLPAFALALAIYWIVAWLARLALTVITLPLAASRSVIQSRVVLDIVRTVVALACGGLGLLAALVTLNRFDVAAAGMLPVAIGVAVAATHLLSARQFLRTRQFADDLLSLFGELAGIAIATLVPFGI